MLTDSSLQVRRIPSHLDVSGIHRCLFFLALICGLLRLCTLSKMTSKIFGICTCLQSGRHKQQFQDQGNSAVLRPAFTGRPSQSYHVCCFPAVASRLISFSPPCTLQKAILIYSDWSLKDTHSSAESWKSVFFSSGAFFMVLKNACALRSLQAYAMCDETLKSGEGLWV